MPAIEITVTEEELGALERKASREGTTVASLVRARIDDLLRAAQSEESARSRDPLLRLAPVRGSQLGDLSTQHDHYLYGVPKK